MKSTAVSESITSITVSSDEDKIMTSCAAVVSSHSMIVENDVNTSSSRENNITTLRSETQKKNGTTMNNNIINSSSSSSSSSSNRKTTTMTTASGQVRVIKHSPMTRLRRLTQQHQKEVANTVTSPVPTAKAASVSATNGTSPSTDTTTNMSTNSNNMLSLEEQLPRLVADTTQLRHALDAFEYAYSKPVGWSTKYYNYFINAGIDSMNALYNGCKDNTINLDLEFVGISYNNRIDSTTQMILLNFLPGPVGIRCFRLAQMAAEKVRQGEADVKYVHRPENGQCGDEIWRVVPHSTTSTSTSTSINNTTNNESTTGIQSYNKPQWTLHVDCAGFVRSVLKHITKDVVQLSLSDRSFMRAKDFYRLYETIDQTVLNFSTGTTTNNNNNSNNNNIIQQLQQMSTIQGQVQSENQSLAVPRKILQWKVITDLRMVIPGDVIVYRPKGNAAGGSAFTVNDRCDLKHLLKAIKVALLYHNEMELYGPNHLVTTNLGRHPSIKEYVTTNLHILNTCGIHTCSHLRQQLRTSNLNNLVYETFHTNIYPYYYNEQTINLMIECSTTTAKNTGHIVFAAGPAILINTNINEYRIKVVHSTKYGVNQTEGVQQYYRRFQLIEGHDGAQWTRRTIPTVPILSPKEKVVVKLSSDVVTKTTNIITTTPTETRTTPTPTTTSLPMIPSMTNDCTADANMSPVPDKTTIQNNDSTKNVITSDITSLTISLNNSTMNDSNDKKKKNNLKKQKKDIDNVVAPLAPSAAVVVVVDDDDVDNDETTTNDVVVSPPTSPAKIANLKRKTSSRSTIMENSTIDKTSHFTSTIAAVSSSSKNNTNSNNDNIKNDNSTIVNEEDNDDEDNDIDGDDPEDEQDAPADNNNIDNNVIAIAKQQKQKQKQQQILVLSPKARTETISTILPKTSMDVSTLTMPPLPPPSRPKKISTKTKSSPPKGVHIIRDDDDDDDDDSNKVHHKVDNPVIANTTTCSTSTENEYVLTENDLLLLELINEEGGITSSSLNDELAGQANVEVLAARMCF